MFPKSARSYAYLYFFVTCCSFSNLPEIGSVVETDFDGDIDNNIKDGARDNQGEIYKSSVNSTSFDEIQRFFLQTAESIKNMNIYTHIAIFGFVLLLAIMVVLIIYICKKVRRE